MFKNLLEVIAVVKAVGAILAEGGGVRDFLCQAHTQEPAVRDLDLNLLHQTAFGVDTEEIAQSINLIRRTGSMAACRCRAVKMGNGIADKFKVDRSADFMGQVVFGDEFVESDGFELVLLRGGISEHDAQSVFCTDLIRSKSEPA